MYSGELKFAQGLYKTLVRSVGGGLSSSRPHGFLHSSKIAAFRGGFFNLGSIELRVFKGIDKSLWLPFVLPGFP